MRYDPIAPQLFVENRKNFIDHMEPGSVAIFMANDALWRCGDVDFNYRQNSDFFYLTGIDQEKSILVLAPGHPNPKYREVLFVIEPDELMVIWNGRKLSHQEAKGISGIDTIMNLAGFDNVLLDVMNFAGHVYLNQNEHPRYSSDVVFKDIRFSNELRIKYPAHSFKRSAPILAGLRKIKSSIEIELIKNAINITEKAFRRVLQYIKPGTMEYEIQAEIDHEFTINRAGGHAYPPIIASGGNACYLHYITNNEVCKDGDLILLDFGAEYANYAADLSRTIPVNGKFSERQKAVYNAVLDIQKESVKLFKSGTTIDAINKEVCKMMEAKMIGLGLFTKEDVSNQNPEKPLYSKYYMHSIGHFMGLDVHDSGTKFDLLMPGMIVTVEPGIYIAEEKIGVRIENNILVTENEPIDLTINIPREVEEIESLMLQSLPY